MTESPSSEAHPTAVELDRDECLELLRTARIGRVVLSVGCLPVALPVGLAVRGDDVVFSAVAGSTTDASIAGEVVSVEVDEIDPVCHTGWSVLVTGVARLVTDEVESASVARVLRPGAPGPHPPLIKVQSTLISGWKLACCAAQKVDRRPA